MKRQRNKGGSDGMGLFLLVGGLAAAYYFLTKSSAQIGTAANPVTVAGQSVLPVDSTLGPTAPQGPGISLVYGTGTIYGTGDHIDDSVVSSGGEFSI